MAVPCHLRRAGRQTQAQAQQGRSAAAAQFRYLPGRRSRQGGEAFRREGRQQQGVRAETVAVLRLVQAPGKAGAGGGDGGIVHGVRQEKAGYVWGAESAVMPAGPSP